MPRTFVIDGNPIEFRVWSFDGSMDLLDVEVVGKRSRETIPAGQSRTYFAGITVDGQRIEGTYRFVERRDDGTYVFQTWSRDATIGSEGK